MSRYYWPTDDWSTPADDFCMHEPPAPNRDFRCIRPIGHPGDHEHVWCHNGIFRDYSHKDRKQSETKK